jgi:glycosyltransferase involved in cell wall biosynthesis
MAVLSCIVPSYKDHLLYKTVKSLLDNAVLDIEVIPVLDGYTDELPDDPRVKPVIYPDNKGMRGATNSGLAIATGDYVMKSDSHCLYAPGFDKVLTESCAEDWLMIPRRYSLNEKNWDRDITRPVYDYHYFTYPVPDVKYGYDMAIIPDNRRTQHRKNPSFNIDDIMIMQGSCWLANRKYFMEHIGLLDGRNETYGSFACEPAEIAFKYWLGGGAVKVNKNTWYAHLKKMQFHYDEKIYGKNYKIAPRTARGHTYATKHWMNNEEPNMIHKLSWLIEKFWPVPTWPENYKELC